MAIIPMNMEKEYITKEREKQLHEELNELKTVKRKEVLEVLAFAKSLGDLSENAEYQNARESQAKIEERISEIEHILKTAIIVTKKKHDVVGLASIVIVQKEGDKEKKTYEIVGSEESDLVMGKVSYRSPLGSALFGKNKGDIVSFPSPNGVMIYKIIEIK